MPYEDGQFVIDPSGRRLMHPDGRFFVHSNGAGGCCEGCPCGTSAHCAPDEREVLCESHPHLALFSHGLCMSIRATTGGYMDRVGHYVRIPPEPYGVSTSWDTEGAYSIVPFTPTTPTYLDIINGVGATEEDYVEWGVNNSHNSEGDATFTILDCRWLRSQDGFVFPTGFVFNHATSEAVPQAQHQQTLFYRSGVPVPEDMEITIAINRPVTYKAYRGQTSGAIGWRWIPGATYSIPAYVSVTFTPEDFPDSDQDAFLITALANDLPCWIGAYVVLSQQTNWLVGRTAGDDDDDNASAVMRLTPERCAPICAACPHRSTNEFGSTVCALTNKCIRAYLETTTGRRPPPAGCPLGSIDDGIR